MRNFVCSACRPPIARMLLAWSLSHASVAPPRQVARPKEIYWKCFGEIHSWACGEETILVRHGCKNRSIKPRQKFSDFKYVRNKMCKKQWHGSLRTAKKSYRRASLAQSFPNSRAKRLKNRRGSKTKANFCRCALAMQSLWPARPYVRMGKLLSLSLFYKARLQGLCQEVTQSSHSDDLHIGLDIW